jgi:predicted PurR-regulated permease PerM
MPSYETFPEGGEDPDGRKSRGTNYASFAVILFALVLTGWCHLGVLALSILFSYFALSSLAILFKGRHWPAIAVFLGFLGFAAYGLAYFVQSTTAALPGIAEKAVPAVAQWASAHRIRLPFTDFDSLKTEAMKGAASEASDVGKFADFARGATAEFVYFIVGVVVALGIFIAPRSEFIDRPSAGHYNLYSVCRDEICLRFARFYESFFLVMKAQMTISAIDTTLTGIFVAVMGLPYLVVAVGATFICGLLPVVGNLLSNTLVMALGFMVSPAKGLWALAYLVCIHQLEYFLNGKIIGGRIRSPLWLTLLALVIGESLMGVTGMILAPAILHYIRIESSVIPVLPRQPPRAIQRPPDRVVRRGAVQTH